MRALPILALCLATLAACGPIPVERAEQQCFERARLAQQPRGEVRAGVVSTGQVSTGFKVTVTSDYITGRDPSAVYDSCVFRASGAPPRRPLHSRPDWRG